MGTVGEKLWRDGPTSQQTLSRCQTVSGGGSVADIGRMTPHITSTRPGRVGFRRCLGYTTVCRCVGGSVTVQSPAISSR